MHSLISLICCMLRASLLALAVAVLCACQGHADGGAVKKPLSKGLPYELVVIVPRQCYDGPLRDTLAAVLQCSTPVLPQHESLFRLDVVYTDGNLTPWRTFRNRLIVNIDKRMTRPSMGVAHDITARPQTEVLVTGPSVAVVAPYIASRRDELTALFVEAELEWQAAQLRRKHSTTTRETLEAVCGHSICVPPPLKAAKHGKNFLWTGTNLNDKDQNFVYYSYLWDGRQLNAEQYVAKRDSVMKENIPGAQPHQWMQTARNPESGQPLIIARARTLYNKSVLEVHGLWEMREGALGGAFVAMERIDTVHRRVLVTEGFIYSPHSPKRNLLREMEAALRTFH